MADQDSIIGGNGSGEADEGPQIAALAQYIKDLSVESPSAPQVFQWQVQPELQVEFNLNVNNIADELHEVTIRIEASARSENGVHFVVDLTYGGLFGLRNVPEEAFGPFLLIEGPRLIFPFARQIIANATQDAGFPPLLLEPIDFASAYMAQIQAQQGEGGAGQGQLQGEPVGGGPDDDQNQG